MEARKVAILCKYPFRLSATLRFLVKRNTIAATFGELREFVAAVEADSYDILVVSLSFPHPQVDRIVPIMEQTFGKPVIAFIEDFGISRSAALQNANLRFRIPGQISGPALEHAISKAVREFSAEPNSSKDVSPESQPKRSSEDENNIIVISRGTGPSGSNLNYLDKGRRANGDLIDLLKLESGQFQSVQPGNPESGAAEFGGVGTVAAVQSSQTGGSLPFQDLSPSIAGLPFDTTQGDPISKQKQRAKFNKAKELQRARKSDADLLSLWVCATDALESASGASAKPIPAITQTGRCFLLNLCTASAQGTFGFLFEPCADETVDSLVTLLLDELFEAMEKRNFGASADYDYDLVEIDERLMREEILERARFRSARSGLVAEIEIAYIEHSDMITHVEFEDTEVKEVPLLTISPDTELDFKIYLRLNVNRRYLRYVNERRRLSGGQSARLTGFGVRSVFVEAQQYEAYLMHAARAQVQEELAKRGLRLIKKKRA